MLVSLIVAVLVCEAFAIIPNNVQEEKSEGKINIFFIWQAERHIFGGTEFLYRFSSITRV